MLFRSEEFVVNIVSENFVRVVLPLPLGPTIAIIWPGRAVMLISVRTSASWLYMKLTCLNSTTPFTCGKSMASGLSFISLGVSSTSKIRSVGIVMAIHYIIIPSGFGL